MNRIHRRIELLEQALLPVEEGPPAIHEHQLCRRRQESGAHTGAEDGSSSAVERPSLEPGQTAWLEHWRTNEKRRRARTRRRDASSNDWF